MLMYMMLFFATSHGILGGTDFNAPATLGIYISMLIALKIPFILKHLQLSKIRE